MRCFDELGQTTFIPTTLWFALDQAWNWRFDPALIAHMRLHMMEDLTLPGVVREAQRMELTRQDKSLGWRFTKSVTLVVPRDIKWMLQADSPMVMWTWYERTWPRIVERELGYVPSSYDVRQARFQRWLDRAAARAALFKHVD
jgi:hypothetical protein